MGEGQDAMRGVSRLAGLRVVVGVALTLGAYLTMVLASLEAIQWRRSRVVLDGIHYSLTDSLRRGLVVFAVTGAVLVLVGMAVWLPVLARRRRAVRPVWLIVAVLLAVPAAIPAFVVGAYANRTVEAVAPAPLLEAPTFPTVAPPTSLGTCITASTGCEVPAFRVRVSRLRKTWPVWADVAFAVGLAVPFALLGWAYVRRVRRRSSPPSATDEFRPATAS